MPTVDETATRQRFESHLSPILGQAYGTVLRMTRNPDDAEDLVQDAVLQAFKAFDQFREGTNFKAWFFQILINRFRYTYRKRKREPDIACLDDAPDLYLYVQTSNAGLLDKTSDPAAAVIGKMSEEQIEAAMAALPEEFQIVATLYFIDEMSYEEIASVVGCPIGTVRSRLHRGRKLLQKALWVVAQEHGIVASLTAQKAGAI